MKKFILFFFLFFPSLLSIQATNPLNGFSPDSTYNKIPNWNWQRLIVNPDSKNEIRTSLPGSPPIAICQNISVTADLNCEGTAAASLFDNGSSDPDFDPLTFSVSPIAPYSLGTTNVVLSVSDGQGNTTTCSASILVTDVTAPTIICPSNITANVISNTCANTGP